MPPQSPSSQAGQFLWLSLGSRTPHPRGKPLVDKDRSLTTGRKVKPKGSDVPQGLRAFLFLDPPAAHAGKPFQFEAVARTTRTRRTFFDNLDRFKKGSACTGIAPSRAIPIWVAQRGNGSTAERNPMRVETGVRLFLSAPFHKRFQESAWPSQGHLRPRVLVEWRCVHRIIGWRAALATALRCNRNVLRTYGVRLPGHPPVLQE